MMRERLVELIDYIREHPEKTCPQFNSKMRCKGCRYEELDDCASDRIADYLLANGVIVPPVRIGQKVWEIVSWDENIRECRVSSITQKADGTFKIRLTNLKSKSVYERTPQHIGDIIFLTKEEAEQALKGGEG